MREAGEAIRSSLLRAWDGFWMVLEAEICWLVLSLPIVTAPLAVAGLYYSMHQLSSGESLEWKTFFSGARRYAGAGYRWFGFNLAVIGVLGFYLWFFSSSTVDWGPLAGGLVAGVLALWAALQAFTFPFMLSQEKPSYRTALRNSLVFYLKWPAFAISLVFFNLVIIVLSIWIRFPWLVFTSSLTALIACDGLRKKTEAMHL